MLEARKAQRWILVAGAIVLSGTLLYPGIATYTAWQIVNPARQRVAVAPSTIGSEFDDVSFSSRLDHLVLRGWLFHAAKPTGRSVIFLNGWKSNRIDANWGEASIGADMVQHGYDVLLFDLRACGESQGDRFTLGHKEQRDLLGAYDFMRSRGYAPSRMAIIGGSMGAATEIAAAPQLREVGAMVSDTAFSELQPVINSELPRLSHLPAFFNPGITFAASLFIGENPNIRPVDTVRALPDRAFLFIHATRDSVTPAAHASQLRNASANPRSELLMVETGGHTQSYHTKPELYMATVYAFIDARLGASSTSR